MKNFLIFIINFYIKYVSPHKKPCCRFYPSCSKYSLEAVKKYGAVKGSFMAIWRIFRCNPFNKGGYDPVK